MTIKRTVGLIAPALGVLAASAAHTTTAQALDRRANLVLVLMDRSGSMYDPATCADIGSTGTNKWECGIDLAIKKVKSINNSGQGYFAYKEFYTDYTVDATKVFWNESTLYDNVDSFIANVLTPARSEAPHDYSFETPLAAAYCKGVDYLVSIVETAQKDGGLGESFGAEDRQTEVHAVLLTDGLENSSPAGECQTGGGDTGADHKLHLDSTGKHYIPVHDADVSAGKYLHIDAPVGSTDLTKGLTVGTWQSNVFDKVVSNHAYNPAPVGVAFVPYSGRSDFIVWDITYIEKYIAASMMLLSPSSSLASPSLLSVSAPSERDPATRTLLSVLGVGAAASPSITAAAPAAVTASSNEDYFDFLNAVSVTTTGRLSRMGSGTAQPAGSPFAIHTIGGDANDDGCVSTADYNLVTQYLGKLVSSATPDTYRADVNLDGRINFEDYLVVKSNWGTGCAAPPSAIPVPANAILGFEQLSSWSSSAPLALDATRKEGLYAVSVGGKNWREVNSVKFPTSTFSGVTSKMALDVYIPTQQSNKAWLGQVLLFASCPSAGVNNLQIGASFELTGKPLGKYATGTFAIPANLRAAMTTPHSDFSLKVVVNANDPGYIIDNLRFVP